MALGELKNGIGPDAYAIYQQVLAAVVERDHPVGSLYISENATSPAELYGGMWERIEGRFIMGASDSYPAGTTGGSATHTQAKNEVAGHTHLQRLWVLGHVGNEVMGFGSEQYKVFKASESASILNAGNTGENYNPNGVVPMDILNPYYSAYIWRRVA